MRPNRTRRHTILMVVLVASCQPSSSPWQTRVPPPSAEEKHLGALLGKRKNPFLSLTRDHPASVDSADAWEGRWILDGHLLTLSAAQHTAGAMRRELYVFGFSRGVERYWMMVVTAGGVAADRIDVYWFTIDGDTWQFDQTDDARGNGVAHRLAIWNSRTQQFSAADMESAQPPAQTMPVPTQPAMQRLAAWKGTWRNVHDEPDLGFFVDGRFDSDPIAGGRFIGWFEDDTLRLRSGRKKQVKEVDIWGYCEDAKLYFRLDVSTKDESVITPTLGDPPIVWWWEGHGAGVVLVAPLESKKLADRSVPSRFGFTVASSDTMTVFVEHVADGVHWIASPSDTLKWARIR